MTTLTKRLWWVDRFRMGPSRSNTTCPLCGEWITDWSSVATIEGDGHHGRYAHPSCARSWAAKVGQSDEAGPPPLAL